MTQWDIAYTWQSALIPAIHYLKLKGWIVVQVSVGGSFSWLHHCLIELTRSRSRPSTGDRTLSVSVGPKVSIWSVGSGLTAETSLDPHQESKTTFLYLSSIWQAAASGSGEERGLGRMNWIGRKIHLYNVTIGLYMLDWWERYLFSILSPDCFSCSLVPISPDYSVDPFSTRLSASV